MNWVPRHAIVSRRATLKDKLQRWIRCYPLNIDSLLGADRSTSQMWQLNVFRPNPPLRICWNTFRYWCLLQWEGHRLSTTSKRALVEWRSTAVDDYRRQCCVTTLDLL